MKNQLTDDIRSIVIGICIGFTIGMCSSILISSFSEDDGNILDSTGHASINQMNIQEEYIEIFGTYYAGRYYVNKLHDNKLNVTCWHTSGGISCIPDHMFISRLGKNDRFHSHSAT